MIMAVYCYLDGCDKAAGGYLVEIPNPDRGWCKKCHQQIGTITLIHHFCSPEHALEWLQEYIQSSEQDKELFPEVAETGHYPEKTKEVED